MVKFFSKRNILIIIGIIFILLLAYIILPVSLPIILALITAIILGPFVRLIQSRLAMNRKFAVLMVFIFFIFFIGLSGFFITTKVVTEVINLIGHSPQYINEITNAWLKAEARLLDVAKDLPKVVVNQISNQVQQYLHTFKNDLLDYINIRNLRSFLTEIPSYFVSFLVYLIALYLFLLELPQMKENLINHLTEKTEKKVNFMTSRLSYVIFGFLKAQFLLSIIIFVFSLIGLLFIAPEIALVMSVIIALIDFIPFIGSLLILGPWSLFQFLIGHIALGSQLALLVSFLIIIRRTIEPKIMGIQIGLSPLSTLVTMYLGYQLLGIFGIIFGPIILIIFYSAKEAGIIKIKFKI